MREDSEPDGFTQPLVPRLRERHRYLLADLPLLRSRNADPAVPCRHRRGRGPCRARCLAVRVAPQRRRVRLLLRPAVLHIRRVGRPVRADLRRDAGRRTRDRWAHQAHPRASRRGAGAGAPDVRPVRRDLLESIRDEAERLNRLVQNLRLGAERRGRTPTSRCSRAGCGSRAIRRVSSTFLTS